MNGWDILILAAVALLLFLALRRVIRSRGSCSCGGSCAACGGNCSRCSRDCSAKGKNVKK